MKLNRDDIELLALTVLVARGTALINASVAKYDECRFEPDHAPADALRSKLLARGVFAERPERPRDADGTAEVPF